MKAVETLNNDLKVLDSEYNKLSEHMAKGERDDHSKECTKVAATEAKIRSAKRHFKKVVVKDEVALASQPSASRPTLVKEPCAQILVSMHNIAETLMVNARLGRPAARAKSSLPKLWPMTLGKRRRPELGCSSGHGVVKETLKEMFKK
ncbi:unnamed protein product [Cladocopium goreaui]|uniref:Uncharacterized protein n=1 Tax=Cladocopium goreaui TaxID=2562237 RepID=A0A9P1D1S3_9DINO|nr:unnamed protein product [Cladocopium goreaui]